MYKYNEKLNYLQIQKIDSSIFPRVDLYEDIKDSYNNFKTKYLKECVEHFVELLSTNLQISSISASYSVGNLVSNQYNTDLKYKGYQYYPVTINVTVESREYSSLFLRIPYMDSIGILNVDGNMRIMLNEISSSTSIFWDNSKDTLSLSFDSNKTLSFSVTPTSLKCYLNKYVYSDLWQILNSFNILDNMNLDLTSLLSNQTVSIFKIKQEKVLDWVKEELYKDSPIYKKLKSEEYSLGKLRNILNKTLSIDMCLYQLLSKNVVLPRSNKVLIKNTRVTLDILKELKYNLINEVYIKYIPRIDSKLYLNQYIFLEHIIDKITLPPEILELYPNILDTKIIFPISIVTEELCLFLYDLGYEGIEVASNKNLSNNYFLKFEHDIIGNNFHKIKDFTPFNNETYVYIDDINNYEVTEITDYNNLVLYDMLGLTSLLCRSKNIAEFRELYDRDAEFMKKISMVGDIFSKYLKIALTKYTNKYKQKLLHDYSISSFDPHWFKSLTQMWIKEMWDSKLLVLVDDCNPISILTQVRRVYTNLSRVSSNLRLVSIGQYGKLCPYDTPESNNIGLLNSIAYGCRVIDGIPKSPYYKIINNRIDLSKIHYLSSEDEASVNITDICSIQFTSDYKIIESIVVAKTPSKDNYNEQVTFSSISSLQLNYVTVYPEQLLSPITKLIPFAMYNVAARLQFAVSRIKQSINLLNSEIPRVTTDMYTQLFYDNDDYVIRAKKSGIVTSMFNDYISVKYDEEEQDTRIDFQEVKILSITVVLKKFVVEVGTRFNAGDVLIDSSISKSGIYSPGVNLLCANIVWKGWNYEDAIVISTAAQQKLISLTNVKVSVSSFSDSSIVSETLHPEYTFCKENVLICETIRKTNRKHNKKIKLYSGRNSGILYGVRKEKTDTEVKLIANLLGFKRLSVGDKLAGRHANKGVTSIIENTSLMPRLNNGIPIEVCLNPLGIPSRMNNGQLFENKLGLVAMLLDITIESNSVNGACVNDVKQLLDYVYTIANYDADTAIKKHSELPKALHVRARNRESFIQSFADCFDEYGLAYLYNPETGTYFEEKIDIGVIYMLKMVQEVDDKMHARSFALEEEYTSLHKQPPQGSSNNGGQKIGEMELGALIAHGVSENIYELSNSKSDNLKERFKLILDALKLNNPKSLQENENLRNLILNILNSNFISEPYSVILLRYYLETLGIELFGEDLNAIDFDSLSKTVIPDMNKILSSLQNFDSFIVKDKDIEEFKNIKGD